MHRAVLHHERVVAASVVLHHGFSVCSGVDSGSYLCASVMCDVLLAALCRGPSLVVEVILQLCVSWIVSILVLDLVLGIEVGASWHLASDGIFDVHVDDFVGLCIVLWNSWIHLLLLVHEENLWSCQG